MVAMGQELEEEGGGPEGGGAGDGPGRAEEEGGSGEEQEGGGAAGIDDAAGELGDGGGALAERLRWEALTACRAWIVGGLQAGVRGGCLRQTANTAVPAAPHGLHIKPLCARRTPPLQVGAGRPAGPPARLRCARLHHRPARPRRLLAAAGPGGSAVASRRRRARRCRRQRRRPAGGAGPLGRARAGGAGGADRGRRGGAGAGRPDAAVAPARGLHAGCGSRSLMLGRAPGAAPFAGATCAVEAMRPHASPTPMPPAALTPKPPRSAQTPSSAPWTPRRAGPARCGRWRSCCCSRSTLGRCSTRYAGGRAAGAGWRGFLAEGLGMRRPAERLCGGAWV
jgi:hypothetical protein